MKPVRMYRAACLALAALAVWQAVGSAEPNTVSTPPAATGDESLAMRSARAQLRLAELTLEKAQSMNRRVPGTLTGSMMSYFTDDVEHARLQLRLASKGSGGDAFAFALERAEMTVRLAEAKYRKAAEANQASPGVLTPTDLERWQLAAEIARLQLDRGRALANATAEAKLQWQLEMLGNELAQVKQTTHLLGQNRLGQF